MKKQDHFNQNNIKFIDYKDTEILAKFLNPHARILNRRKTGLTAKNQRALANAIKRSRFMGLLPYVSH
ncbi:MAG: 30S ribosomal protein S18 [Candidatus Nomurabacteria bacterium]|jgi:small subunit ribosomal protein S18|nr:30S ribosomal protein S18 [Candidatus Nomurabacteria bacterium]HCC06383.1 30S ribosomal protein S18 [Candidatus Nomurabacteria bacterium]